MLAAWQTGVTFTLVTVAWVFFRATSLRDASYILGHFFTNLASQLLAIAARDHAAIIRFLFLDFEGSRLAFAVLAVVSLLAIEREQRRGSVRQRIALAPAPLRWTAYSAAMLCIMTLGIFGSAKFIYFQF
jgi:alginate O-acetyltransferase complex protein AlgI